MIRVWATLAFAVLVGVDPASAPTPGATPSPTPTTAAPRPPTAAYVVLGETPSAAMTVSWSAPDLLDADAPVTIDIPTWGITALALQRPKPVLDPARWTVSTVPPSSAPCGPTDATVTWQEHRNNPVHLRWTSATSDELPQHDPVTAIALCPAVNLSDPTVSPGAGHIDAATVDFDPPQLPADPVEPGGDPLSVLVDGDVVGSDPAQVPVPTSCGSHVLTVRQPTPYGTLQASTPFQVDCPGGGGVTEPAATGVLLAQPAVAAVGTTVLVGGTGFPPGAAVSITWQWPAGLTSPALPAPVTADGAGIFWAWVLVEAGSATGPCALAADTGASAAVFIAPGTGQPWQGHVPWRR